MAKSTTSTRSRRNKALPARPGPKGPQAVTVGAREKLASAFERMGGEAGLVKWGKKNPTEFYRLWARLIPKEENVNVNTVGIEDLLAELDARAGASGDAQRLNAMDHAGEMLGLPRPEGITDDTVVEFPSVARPTQ